MPGVGEQTEIIKRIEEICDKFDIRVTEVGMPLARIELAKAFAECEASKTGAQADACRCSSCGKEYCSEDWGAWRCCNCF